MSTLYDADTALWAEEQAALLRRRAAEQANNDELDWLHLAEEIEGVVASEKREVRWRLALIVQHLLKWQYQPALRSRSWQTTLHVQRRDLHAVLADSPSLRSFAASVLAAAFVHGRHDAEQETGLLHLPTDCPWTLDQVLDQAFLAMRNVTAP
jgi:hypothetical protein